MEKRQNRKKVYLHDQYGLGKKCKKSHQSQNNNETGETEMRLIIKPVHSIHIIL